MPLVIDNDAITADQLVAGVTVELEGLILVLATLELLSYYGKPNGFTLCHACPKRVNGHNHMTRKAACSQHFVGFHTLLTNVFTTMLTKCNRWLFRAAFTCHSFLWLCFLHHRVNLFHAVGKKEQWEN